MLHVRIDAPANPLALQALGEGLVRLNEWLMAHASERGVELPRLYDSGVVYRREPVGREWWETARDLLSVATSRTGDCEDLAAYRCAELRHFDNEAAELHVITNPRGSFHCVVLREDGSVEDPSRILLEIESNETGIPMTELARKTTR